VVNVVACAKTENTTENVVTGTCKIKVSEALTTNRKEVQLQTNKPPTQAPIRERAETKNATNKN